MNKNQKNKNYNNEATCSKSLKNSSINLKKMKTTKESVHSSKNKKTKILMLMKQLAQNILQIILSRKRKKKNNLKRMLICMKIKK